MNKIYRVIWSKTKNCYVVVSEYAKRNGKCSSSLNKKLIAAFLAAGTVLSVTGSAWAEPEPVPGGYQVAGSDNYVEPDGDNDAQTVFGSGNTVTGMYGTAWGMNTLAGGSQATAWGYNTVAGIAGDPDEEGTRIYSIYNYLLDEGQMASHEKDYFGLNVTAWGSSTEAVGQDATSFGGGNQAYGRYSTAWGNNTLATGRSSVVFGLDNLARGDQAVAWGQSSVADGRDTTAFGEHSLARLENTGDSSATAFGHGVAALADSATAFGMMTVAQGRASAAFGSGSLAAGFASTAFGSGSYALGYNSLAALGGMTGYGTFKYTDTYEYPHHIYLDEDNNIIPIVENSQVTTFYPMYVLDKINSSYTGKGSVAIGEGAYAFAEYTYAIGKGATAQSKNTIAIGNGASATYDNSIAVGKGAKAYLYDSVAIGNGAEAKGYASEAIGTDTIIKGSNFQGATSVAYGAFNTIDAKDGAGQDGIANSIIGVANTTSKANGTLIFGSDNIIQNAYGNVGQSEEVNEALAEYNSNPTPDNFKAVEKALGKSAGEYGGNVIAIGGANIAGSEGDVSFSQIIGASNKLTSGNYNFLGGYNNTVTGDNNIAIGTGHTITGNSSGAFGDPNEITGDGSYAFGNNNTIETDDGFVLGNNASVSQAGGVALGKDSKASTAAGTTTGTSGYDPVTNGPSSIEDAIWRSTLGAVSVGNDGTATRQITNVAAGSADTDAVNVAQLKAAKVEIVAGDNVQVVTDTSDGFTKYTIHALNAIVEAGENITVTTTTPNTTETNGQEADLAAGGDGTAAGTGTTGEAGGTNTNDHTTTYTVSATGGGGIAEISFNGDNKDAQIDSPKVLNIEGGATGELSDGNIGVESDGKDTLTVKLTRDIKDVDSITVNKNIKVGDNTTIEGDAVTTKTVNADTVKVGDNTTIEGDAITTKTVNADTVKVGDNTTIEGDAITTKTVNADTVKVGDNTTIEGDAVTTKTVNADTVKVGSTSINDNGITTDNGKGPSVTKDGIDGGGKKITNVAPGTADTDAVNVSQLKNASGDIYNELNRLDNSTRKGIAGAAALAALHPMDFNPDDKMQFSAGVGNYRGETAAAVGMFYRPDESVMFSLGGTFGNSDNMVNAGITFGLDGTRNRITRSRTAMAHEIVELKDHIARQDEQIAKLTELVNKLVGPEQRIENTVMFPDVPENHWAYQYVEDLQKQGIIEGYPDGLFKGGRSMTRYEFAAMLDRALRNGAKLDAKIAGEFAPELSRIRVERISGQDNDRKKVERVRVNNEEAATHDFYGSKIVTEIPKKPEAK